MGQLRRLSCGVGIWQTSLESGRLGACRYRRLALGSRWAPARLYFLLGALDAHERRDASRTACFYRAISHRKHAAVDPGFLAALSRGTQVGARRSGVVADAKHEFWCGA